MEITQDGQTKCHECGEVMPILAGLGENVPHSSSTAWLCHGCMTEAIALIEGMRPNGTRKAHGMTWADEPPPFQPR
jgi:hypothetical protein